MKTILSAIALATAMAWVAPPPAEAQGYGTRSKQLKKQRQGKVYRSYRRPASVGPNGLCQRDTGTATSDLDFRNRCDVEEFWLRQERSGSRGGF